MNKKQKHYHPYCSFTLALTGCAGTKAEENHGKQNKNKLLKKQKGK